MPIRVEPHEDEAWNGYLDRVAAAHHLTTHHLLAYIDLLPFPRGVPSHRDHGVALTVQSREAFAAVFDLTSDAVAAMQLQRFNGRLIDLPETTVHALDPLQPDPPDRPGRLLQGRGWLRWTPRTHGCRECLRADPAHWKLSWRIPWALFCPAHLTLIDDLDEVPRNVGPTEEQLAAQKRMLEIAYAPESEPAAERFGFVCQVAAAVDLLARHSNAGFRLNVLADQRPPALVVATLLPAALSLVEDVRTGTDSELLAELFADAEDQRIARGVFRKHAVPQSSPLSRAAAMYRLSDDPHPWRSWRVPADTIDPLPGWVRARIPARIPQMLPMDVYAGDLSDLLYPLPIEQGRTVAAVACVLVAGRPRLADAITALVLPNPCRRPVYAAIARLHAQGRVDAFFAAVAHAATELARRDIDYGARRWPVNSEQHPLVAPMLNDLGEIAHPRVLAQWIHEVWAAGHRHSWTQLGEVKTRRRGFVDELNERHHDELVAAAERAAATIAPAPQRALAS